MKTVGIHTYLGGMAIGARDAGLNVIGSVETWKPGRIGARHLNRHAVWESEEEMAEYVEPWELEEIFGVIANPPCSRYSTMATNHFDDQDKTEVDKFAEMGEVLNFMENKAPNANFLWWETGPILWGRGRPMISDIQKALEYMWNGDVYSFLVRLDLRYAGVPQRRPRCHVVHVRESAMVRFPEIRGPQWPIAENLREWIDTRVDTDREDPMLYHRVDDGGDPLTYTRAMRADPKGFHAVKPVEAWDVDPYGLAVVSSRPFVWVPENRWWTFMEHAALQGYYGPNVDTLPDVAGGVVGAHRLLSKSVSPLASAWMVNNIIFPLFGLGNPIGGRILPERDEAGTYVYDANVTDSNRKINRG